MVLQKDPFNGFLMKAARMALETGNPEHILIWVPEESENSLKNLLEKTWCERNKHKNRQNPDNDWFFTTINRLFKAGRKPFYPGMKTAGPKEKLIYL